MKINICQGCHCNFTFGGARPRSSTARIRPSPTKTPLLLKCGHTFCETCMAQYLKKRFKGKNQEYKAEISCPLCKKVTLLPNDVHDLPINIYIAACIFSNPLSKLEQNLNKFVPSPTKKLLQIGLSKQTQNKETKVKLCGMCEDKKATCECKECENILCTLCFNMAHKISAAIRHHQPVAFEQDIERNNNTDVSCSEHNKPIEYFCKTDNTRICSRCFITGEHKQHDIQSFEEKNIEFIDKIELELPKANAILSCLKRIDKKILAVMPTFKTEAKNLIEEVSSSFLHLHALLQIKEMEILENICKIYDDSLNILEERRISSEVVKNKLDNTLKEAKQLCDNSSLIVDAQGILEEIQQVNTIPCILSEDSDNKSLKWVINGSSEILTAVDSFGSLVGDMADRIKFLTSEESPTSIDLNIDDDTESVCSMTSSVSFSSKEGLKRCDSISSRSCLSTETNQDTDETTDGDNCRTRSTKAVQEIIAMPVVKGPPQKVVITHIHSPSSFYLQLASNKKKLETLSHNMNNWCRSGSANKHIPLTLEKNMLVLAKYSLDKQWYRARVVSVEDPAEDDENQGFQVWVTYIDFGNEENVAIKDLRNMQDRFMLYPEFRVHCSLSDILPLDENNTWDLVTVQEFAKLTENKILIMNTFEKELDAYVIDLTYMPSESVSDDLFVSVRDVLIFLEIARFQHHSDQAKRMTQQPSYSKEDYFSATPIKSGSFADVEIVTYAHSPYDFYAVMHGEERDYYNTMMEHIQTLYNGDKSKLFTLYYPRVGVLCVAKGADGKWYRAKVTAPPVQRRVKVLIVDIGEEIIVHYDWLRKIHSDFVKLPVQAVHCKLAGVAPVDDEEKSDIVKHWCQSVLMTSCGTAQFVRWGDPSDVVLWLGPDQELLKDSSINSILVSKSLVCSTDSTLCSTNSGEELPMKPIEFCKKKKRSTSSSSSQRTPVQSPLRNSSDANTPVASPKKAVDKYPAYQYNQPLDEVECVKESSGYKGSETARKLEMDDETNKKRIHRGRGRKSKDCTESNTAGYKKRSPVASSKKPSLKAEQYRKDSSKLVPTQTVEVNSKCVQKEIEKALNDESDEKENESNKSPYIQVIMSHFVSPSEFRIRIQEKEKQLKQLMTALQVSCENIEGNDLTLSNNSNCAVRNKKDNTWYRGIIKQVNGTDSVDVEIVDFGGNIKVTDLKDLKILAPEFCQTECAAIKCFLADLVPAGTSDLHKWSSTAKDFMSGHIFEKNLYVKLMGDTCDSGVPVDLIVEELVPETAFDPASQTYHSLRQKILDEGLALPSKTPSPLPSPDQINPFFRTIFEQISKLSVADGSPVRAEATCAAGEVLLGAVGGQPEEQLVKSVLPHVKITELPNIPPPSHNSEVKVVPTFVGHDGVIYVQPVDWEDSISQMSKELQTLYKDVVFSPVFWEEGQFCVARFPDDGNWYRAQVLEIKPTAVKVFYTDYGNSAWVPLEHMRDMMKCVAESHPLAMQCVLYEAEPSAGDGVWPNDVLCHVHEMVVNYICKIFVHSVMPSSLILVTLTTDNGIQFPKSLFDKGLAIDAGDMREFYDKSSIIGAVWTKNNPYNQLEIPEIGSDFCGTVTHVELPNLIYLQRSKIPEAQAVDIVTSGEIANINNQITEFEEMAEALNTGSSMHFVNLPDVGMKCAGKFSVDDRWYRALCVEQHLESDSCLLVFVDFGTPEEVPRSNIRQLPREFWTIPAQAIRCYFNIVPPHQQCVFKLSSLYGVVTAVTNKEILAKVTQREPATVDLLEDVGTGELRLAYEDIITAGLALLPARLDVREVLSASQPDVVIETDDLKAKAIAVQSDSTKNATDKGVEKSDLIGEGDGSPCKKKSSQDGKAMDWFEACDIDGSAPK